MAFYKREDNQILEAPNFVKNASYELFAQDKDTYEYPVDGWYWFDTYDQALIFFADQVRPPATSVSMAGMRAALLEKNLLTAVNNLVPSLGPEAEIDWEYRNSVEREAAFVAGMKTLLNLTDEQVNEIFSIAEAIDRRK